MSANPANAPPGPSSFHKKMLYEGEHKNNIVTLLSAKKLLKRYSQLYANLEADEEVKQMRTANALTNLLNDLAFDVHENQHEVTLSYEERWQIEGEISWKILALHTELQNNLAIMEKKYESQQQVLNLGASSANPKKL